MNDKLQQFARQTLKDDLSQCTEGQQITFKLMYAKPTEPRHRTPEAIALIKAANVESIVDDMPADKLDWAMQQVQKTLDRETKP